MMDNGTEVVGRVVSPDRVRVGHAPYDAIVVLEVDVRGKQVAYGFEVPVARLIIAGFVQALRDIADHRDEEADDGPAN
jgi:hypothetical protein